MSLISWFKVDDQLAFNAKVMLAGNSAMGLWVRAGSWSSAQLTGGFIPTHMANAMANAMANPCDTDALVMAGLWHEVGGGFQFHDWADFQPDAEMEKQKRKATSEARSKAGKAGAAARWSSKSDGNDDGKPMANEWQTDAPVPSRPVPPEAKASGGASQAPPTAKRGSRIPEGWTPSDDLFQSMSQECPHVDQRSEYLTFMDHWKSAPGSKGVKLDWEATYRNWIRRAAKSAPKSANRATDRMRAGYDAMAGYTGPQEDPWTRKELEA